MKTQTVFIVENGKETAFSLTSTEEHLSHPFIYHFLVLYCVESKEMFIFILNVFVC